MFSFDRADRNVKKDYKAMLTHKMYVYGSCVSHAPPVKVNPCKKLPSNIGGDINISWPPHVRLLSLCDGNNTTLLPRTTHTPLSPRQVKEDNIFTLYISSNFTNNHKKTHRGKGLWSLRLRAPGLPLLTTRWCSSQRVAD